MKDYHLYGADKLGQRIKRSSAHGQAVNNMEGEVLANNHEMLNLVTKLGFRIEASGADINMKHVSLGLWPYSTGIASFRPARVRVSCRPPISVLRRPEEMSLRLT